MTKKRAAKKAKRAKGSGAKRKAKAGRRKPRARAQLVDADGRDRLSVVYRRIDSLTPYEQNARTHAPEQVEQIIASIKEFGWTNPILIDEDNGVVAGHGRILAAVGMGFTDVPCITLRGLTDTQRRAYVIADNKLALNAGWDDDLLRLELLELKGADYDLALVGFSPAEILRITAEAGAGAGGGSGSLAEQFGVVPTTVLNARDGRWQERKQAWLALGIRSHLGREATSYGMGLNATLENDWKLGDNKGSGTSIFDPMLCELACRWFSPPGGLVLDPFAGGAVRGVVTSCVGRRYVGVDLSSEQVEENRKQWGEIVDACPPEATEPEWIVGDSRTALPDVRADLVFSCPPYANLEVYSKDPADISNMPWAGFRDAYRAIIAESVARLEDDRFAFWVVGEVRGRDGNYLGLVPETIRAFEDAGAALYNEAVLVTMMGSLPPRIRRQFVNGRKFGKTHQTVFVFLKGNAKRATAAIGEVEFGEAPEEEAAQGGG